MKLRTVDPQATADERRWLYGFFDAYIDNSPACWQDGPDGGGILWSEDYGFCNRWRELGGEVWCDPEIQLGHIGTKIYQGDVRTIYQPTEAKPAVESQEVEMIRGWQVPAGDPWFGPQLEADGAMDTEIITEALTLTEGRHCAIDVGAHIGTWTRPLAAHFERVVALEPEPKVFRLLEQNINGAAGKVQLMNVAAWDQAETLRLQAGPYNSGETVASAVNGSAIDLDEVAVCRGLPLDDLQLDQVDLIKIDVEGAELRVLQGAELTLRRYRPVVVLEEAYAELAAADWLKQRGYRERFRKPILPGHPKDNVVYTPVEIPGHNGGYVL